MVLPNGTGISDEVVEAISWSRVGQNTNPCIFMNVNGYYNGLQKVYQQMVEEGFLLTEDYKQIEGFIKNESRL
ncbi:LOG family protein [Facklamia sp. P12937]|uniref:LOG family protein n=1 Tax=Facklamia sp. P12937 TaxID=3421949 RepID=UPI003D17FA68